jgi:coenzyme F420-0:L-glutamate ligase/coenzyme F420-1:gamma-L-glutamate ligase
MTAGGSLLVRAVTGLSEVRAGDVLAELIVEHGELMDGDVVVVTSKIVSKAEGRVVEVDADDPWARTRLAESEAVRVLRRREELVITETRHGFVCAASGVDFSNVARGRAVLLPVDPDRSARRIRDGIRGKTGLTVGVIVSDTFGRAWRNGLTDVAIGVAGIAAIVDLRGRHDSFGRELVSTEVCVADEIASAAELVMGKAAGVPVVVVRGVDPEYLRESSVAGEIVRKYGEDLFR